MAVQVGGNITTIHNRVLGRTIPLRIFLRERTNDSNDGHLARMFGVSVNITGPQNESIVANGSTIFVKKGVALYHWDTSGLDEGVYKIDSPVMVNNEGKKVKGQTFIRLTEDH